MKLNERDDDIGDTVPTNVRAVQLRGEQLIAENEQALDSLCQQLV